MCYRSIYIEWMETTKSLDWIACLLVDIRTRDLTNTKQECCSSRHQIACFKATEGLHPPHRAALSHQYSVASFATLLALNCLTCLGSAVRCTILLWLWSIKFADGCYSTGFDTLNLLGNSYRASRAKRELQVDLTLSLLAAQHATF
jgi:hypothetical protein